jgi:hypothetical protein
MMTFWPVLEDAEEEETISPAPVRNMISDHSINSIWNGAECRRENHTRSLHQKAQNIPRNEDLGHPGYTHKSQSLAFDHDYYSSEFHVDTRGEEGRCDEEEGALHDVWSQSPIWGFLGGHCAADVAYQFD